MKKNSQNPAKEIRNVLSINWNEASLDKFISGLYIESEEGVAGTKSNNSDYDRKRTDETSWAHLEDLHDYYTKLGKR